MSSRSLAPPSGPSRLTASPYYTHHPELTELAAPRESASTTARGGAKNAFALVTKAY